MRWGWIYSDSLSRGVAGGGMPVVEDGIGERFGAGEGWRGLVLAQVSVGAGEGWFGRDFVVYLQTGGAWF